MKILLIEDDPVFLQILEIYCEKMGSLFQVQHIEKVLDKIQQTTPDIIIADIYMNQQSTIELFKREEMQIAPIIFISNSQNMEEISESLKIPFSLFLKKPLEPISLELHVQYLVREYQKFKQVKTLPKAGTIIVKGKYNQDIKLNYDEILYAKSDRNYLTLYLTNGKIYTYKYSITKFEEESPSYFIRISKSYIINLYSSSKWRANLHYFYFENKTFTIGKKYMQDVIEKLKSMYLPFKFDEL